MDSFKKGSEGDVSEKQTSLLRLLVWRRISIRRDERRCEEGTYSTTHNKQATMLAVSCILACLRKQPPSTPRK
jgi:hypothetical protein